MKSLLILIVILSLFLVQCDSPTGKESDITTLNKNLPRALFLTTGIGDNNVELAQGVVIAVQSLNKRGIPVRLETRNILYDYEQLSQYDILILSTFNGYHDADRKYSLSYMTDTELKNLSRFVSEGGIMISGDNVGRNDFDGTDRIIKYQKLTHDNWALSKCFGVHLSERNMTGYHIEGEIPAYSNWDIHPNMLSPVDIEKWTLVTDSIISDKLQILGYWKKDTDSVPAIIENKYENGVSYLLASAGFLHPVNDGGYWSEKQIENFYNYVVDEYYKINQVNIELNPWPNGHDLAFCVTLNAQGERDQYKRVFKILKKHNIKPTIFVNGLVHEDMVSYLKSTKYPLESNGYSYSNFHRLTYAESLDDILQNAIHWDIDFRGFRFPYTKPGFWGMLTLDEYDYLFESSIGANNIDFIRGSVFPHNIVIANDGYYKTTDILEISPTYHDDYYFLREIHGDHLPNPVQMNKDVMIYTRYLENYWEYAVKPYHGLMVYLGHPQYVGYNDTTSTSLTNLINKVKQDNTWVTTINEVADFRRNLSKLRFYCEEKNNESVIKVIAPEDIVVENVTITIPQTQFTATAEKGGIKVIDKGESSQIIFDAFNGQIVTIQN